MKNRNVRYGLLVGLTLCAACLVHGIGVAESVDNPVFFDFPLQVGQWRGEDIPMDTYVFRSLETPYVLLRDYRHPRWSEPVNLALVWFDDTNIAFHAPQACFGGVGNRVGAVSRAALPGLGGDPVSRLTLEKNGRGYASFYWYCVEGEVVGSQAQIRAAVLKHRLANNRAGAVMVRLLTPQHGEDAVAIDDFTLELMKILPDYTAVSAFAGEES